jgi:hypothetical protein
VMETHGNFIGPKSAIPDPRLRIVQQLTQGHRYLKMFDSDITLALPKLSSPAPDIADAVP